MLISRLGGYCIRRLIVRSLLVVRVNSNDGDTHYVFWDTELCGKNQHAKDYNEIEVKQESKKEASRPLKLNRAE
jgi:hypothetical protein